MVNRGVDAVAIEPGEFRDFRGPLTGGELPVAGYSSRGRFIECSGARCVKRFAVSAPKRELAGAAYLLGQRSPRSCGRRGQRAKTHAVAPEQEGDQHQCENDQRFAEEPDQSEE